MMNLTQHLTTLDQQGAGVFDLPRVEREKLTSLLTFNEIPTREDMIQRALEVGEIADANRDTDNAVMVGGALWFMPYLLEVLKQHGLKPYYAFSKRVSVDTATPNGVVKKSVFVHEGFIPA